MPEPGPVVRWSDYMAYRVELRGFDRQDIERILRYAEERYFDTVTTRLVAVGRDRMGLLMIPYEIENEVLAPVTVHRTTRQQLTTRFNSGRLTVV